MSKTRVWRVAVTGGVGCGKSTVAAILSSLGAETVDADELAHRVIRRGQPAHAQIVERFGPQVLRPDGEIDRNVLGRVVFADDGARAALNAIVHPPVRAMLNAWLEERKQAGNPLVVVVPLLFEVGWTAGWDAVVCVAADEDVALQRLQERGLAPADARRRMAAQWPVAEKARRSDYVIWNNVSRQELERTTRSVWSNILEKEG